MASLSQSTIKTSKVSEKRFCVLQPYVIEKLEEIEPSFNPVPEYEYEDEEEEDEEDDVVVDAVIDDDDQEIDVELVKLAAKEDEPPAEEDEGGIRFKRHFG